MRLQWWKTVLLAGTAAISPLCLAATMNGRWVAEVSSNMIETQYAHVELKVENQTVSGMWGTGKVHGTLKGSAVTLELTGDGSGPTGSVSGTLNGDTVTGSGMLASLGRRGTGAAGPIRIAPPQAIQFKLTPEKPVPAAPQDIQYTPTTFYAYYSATNKPELHIFPGDTVRTWAPDDAGVDQHGKRIARGVDMNIGPIYVEGALPGDTLVVHLLKVRTNRPNARQGSRINPHAATPAYQQAAQYDPAFNSEYHLDPEKGIATLTHPSDRMKNFTVPIKPMLGCISVAPAGMESYRGTDLGPWGGNLDYNEVVEGATLYFPVSHPGALFGFGDGHAAMGDGEVTGSALETSLDVDFKVELIRNFQTAQVRAENKDYLMSFGVAGSVADSIQASTSQLATWIKQDYGLNDNEVALLLGAVMKYDITELVDAHYDVVAKVPKSILANLK